MSEISNLSACVFSEIRSKCAAVSLSQFSFCKCRFASFSTKMISFCVLSLVNQWSKVANCFLSDKLLKTANLSTVLLADLLFIGFSLQNCSSCSSLFAFLRLSTRLQICKFALSANLQFGLQKVKLLCQQVCNYRFKNNGH